MPESTELPMVMRACLAFSNRSLSAWMAKVRVMWLQNSTLIPTAITRLTKETALRVMDHQYIKPPRLISIRMTQKRIIVADLKIRIVNTIMWVSEYYFHDIDMFVNVDHFVEDDGET